MLAGTAESARPTFAVAKIFYDVERHLHHRHDDHLRDALQWVQHEWRLPAVPQRDENLPLVVGVDKADKIPQHDAMFVAEPGAGKDDSGEARVIEMDRDAGRDQMRLARRDRDRPGYTGAQVQPGRTVGGVDRQLRANPLIEDFDVEFLHGVFGDLRGPMTMEC